MYDFSRYKKKLRETEEWLRGELASIQTGRATPAMLDGVKVDSYGAQVPLNQVASLSTEDARTIRIVPWEADVIQNIEAAIRDADLGVSVSSDEKGVRVHFPELTTETREKFKKVVRKRLEGARVSVRNERDEIWEDIQEKEKEGEMSEDEKFAAKDEMEKLTKEANENLEAIAEKKEKEIMGGN